jgi:homoserine kinase type II
MEIALLRIRHHEAQGIGAMHYVYIVQHVHVQYDASEEVKLIGAYSSGERAEEAVSRLRQQPGFSETATGFEIERYEVDKDHWCEGFFTDLIGNR